MDLERFVNSKVVRLKLDLALPEDVSDSEKLLA